MEKGNGCVKEIFQWGQLLSSNVIPVLHEAIQILEEPPERRAKRKQPEKMAGPVQHHAASCAAEGPGIDEQDVPEPQGSEGEWLERLEPCEAIPSQHPGQSGQNGTEPSPPGERMRRQASLVKRGALL